MNEENSDRGKVTFRFLAEPSDVNFGGKVHGGEVMKWIDQAGFSCAMSWSSNYSVTVYISGIRFYKPIHIGNLVEIKSSIIYTGNSSMHFAVDVYSQELRKGKKLHNCHCVIVFVAVDENGKSVPVPKFIPQNEEERDLEAYARDLIQMRKDINDRMDKRNNPAKLDPEA